MSPLLIAVIGTVVRSVLAVGGSAGVATSDAVQAGSGLGGDLQAIFSAISVLVSLLWGVWQKYRSVPVEERTIS